MNKLYVSSGNTITSKMMYNVNVLGPPGFLVHVASGHATLSVDWSKRFISEGSRAGNCSVKEYSRVTCGEGGVVT